jgi:hypothetical protein
MKSSREEVKDTIHLLMRLLKTAGKERSKFRKRKQYWTKRQASLRTCKMS